MSRDKYGVHGIAGIGIYIFFASTRRFNGIMSDEEWSMPYIEKKILQAYMGHRICNLLQQMWFFVFVVFVRMGMIKRQPCCLGCIFVRISEFKIRKGVF